MSRVWALGAGLATPAADGGVLEAWYPLLRLPDEAESAALAEILGAGDANLGDRAEVEQVARLFGRGDEAWLNADGVGGRRLICRALVRDEEIGDTAAAYLKLHLLSARLARPNSLNLDGLFRQLPTLAWTSLGPMLPEAVAAARADEYAAGRVLWVHAVDKFPPLTQYLVPPGVRIADSARVRLGAWIGEGTTIMHSGSINFNAGTEGVAMVEGRVAQGVIVGDNSDIGGGASTLGTLSGGGTELVSLGRNCLLGANAGLGIPLGDRCTLESGLYLTAGTKVEVLDDQRQPVRQCPARDLAGGSDLVFWRNSLTGAVQCQPNPRSSALNPDLHDHN